MAQLEGILVVVGGFQSQSRTSRLRWGGSSESFTNNFWNWDFSAGAAALFMPQAHSVNQGKAMILSAFYTSIQRKPIFKVNATISYICSWWKQEICLFTCDTLSSSAIV